MMEKIRIAAVIKKVLFLVLFAVGTVGITYGAVQKTESSGKKIKVKGENGGDNTDETSPRSEPIFTDIEAYLYAEEGIIESIFNINMGVITITVEDASGAILIQSTANTSVCGETVTDIAMLASGDYTVNYLTEDGEIFYGNFTID